MNSGRAILHLLPDAFLQRISASGFKFRCGVKVKSSVANVPSSYCLPGKMAASGHPRFAAPVADGRFSGWRWCIPKLAWAWACVLRRSSPISEPCRIDGLQNGVAKRRYLSNNITPKSLPRRPPLIRASRAPKTMTLIGSRRTDHRLNAQERIKPGSRPFPAVQADGAGLSHHAKIFITTRYKN